MTEYRIGGALSLQVLPSRVGALAFIFWAAESKRCFEDKPYVLAINIERLIRCECEVQAEKARDEEAEALVESWSNPVGEGMDA